MATLNRKSATTHCTHEGAPAKRIDAEAQLRRSVMACLLWESEFYEGGVSIAERIADGVDNLPLDVAASIAVEAREQMHLRHVPLLIVSQMAKRGGRVVGDTLARVIQRADELSEFVSIYWRDGKRPLSAQIKRGLAQAFIKFNEYQLAKYNRDRDVKLRDVLFLCHAKPNDAAQADVWKRLVDGELATPDTWETTLSASGGEDKLAHWTRLLAEGKLGGLALLRNLRNMQQAGVDNKLLSEAIINGNFNRVLPFRFIAAAKYAPRLEPALEQAMFAAVAELPKLQGRTALLVDHSGSMQWPLSAKSDLNRFEAASGLSILVRELCEDSTVIAFHTKSFIIPPRRGFALRDALNSVGWGGTNTEAAKLAADKLGYDRIIILTDEQSHQAISNPKGVGYMINVASAQNGIGYGAWTHLDGWSEAIVKYIVEAERQ